jgi:hypothetical protein
VRDTALTLLIGAVGGALAAWIGLPLAWMIGAMLATTAAAMAGGRIVVQRQLRALMVTVLGVMLGSAFHPEILRRLGDWLGGIALLAAYIPVVTAIVYLYFRRFTTFGRTTAYFSAMPGGLNEMIIVGEAMGGEGRAIALVHATRILVVVMTIPFYFRFVERLGVPAAPPGAGLGALPLADAALLTLCGVLGWSLARLLRVPAAQLVGPMMLSAAMHLGGLTASRPPAELVAVAQIVVGSAIGGRFAGLRLVEVSRILLVAVGAALLMLVLTVAATALLGDALGTSRAGLALALAPGGLAEMSLVALALGVDTAFVATMHVLRIAIIVILAPAAFRLARAWRERRLKP